MTHDIIPELITLDLLLPGMDGWECLARIKQLPWLACIPVVIVSIVADNRKGLSLGASAVLQKPVGRTELQDVLSNGGFTSRKPDGAHFSILVVDDDRSAADILAGILASHQYTVEQAHGGREAIEAVARQRPDLILLDLMMPDINGFDVIEALGRDPASAAIPVIVMTAKTLTADERARLDRQASHVIEKSGFNSQCFITEVRRALALRRKESG